MVKPGKIPPKNEKIPPKIQENLEKMLRKHQKSWWSSRLSFRSITVSSCFQMFVLRLSLPQRKCRIHRGFAMNVPLDLIYDITGVRIFTYLKPLATDVSNPTKKWTWFIANPEQKGTLYTNGVMFPLQHGPFFLQHVHLQSIKDGNTLKTTSSLWIRPDIVGSTCRPKPITHGK